jgi:S-DNA-T family DNA segregation ATPase FtsK/SpoIIIE
MAKKKSNPRKNPRTQPESGHSRTRQSKPATESAWKRFFRFIALPPVRRLILVIILIALLYWLRPTLVAKANEIFSFLGWGIILVIAAIICLVTIIWRRKLASAIYHWNQWLGGVSLALAAWGILALIPAEGIISQTGLGGSFGQSIIGQDIVDYPVWMSLLRLLVLVIIGIILIAPGACVRAIASFIVWFGKQFQRRPRPQIIEEPRLPRHLPAQVAPSAAETIPPPETIVPPEIPRTRSEGEAETVPAPTQEQRDLRQVAQEVWKKYGESPSLVTVDGWRLPPIDILDVTPETEFGQADNLQRARLIEEALASYGVEAKVVQINAGPTVTQFGVEPGWDRKMKEIKERDRDGNVSVRLEEVSKTRVKVERITSLANDLALALAAPSIRIEAPVPGKSMVGVEVPNTISGVVSLRGVIETSAFQKTTTRSKLALALGKGAGGEAVAGDLSRMPHLLIAGATGSGKTVCLNSVICCLLLHNVPSELRFIMIDPKRVELTPFNSIPHLATPVIVDTGKALSTLRWLNQEMDNRYQKMATASVRNIEGYNKKNQGTDKMPYLVLVIDELADLMMTGFDEVEHILCRLAQLARATGIHLVVATQRPSVDVITGLIKANFPTRISFAVTSQVDSRTILDMAGAEKLLGKGDMLYMPTEAAKPKRLQGCFVSDSETERLVYFWSSQVREEEPAHLSVEQLVPSVTAIEKKSYPEDPLLEAARELARDHKQISTSFLQRRLHIGYPRAARLMDQLEEEMGKGGENPE